jgi:transcriptional regulator with XRE-family HTH domain
LSILSILGEIKMSLGDNIRNLRLRKNLKQDELAKKAGVSRLMLGKYALPSAETLQKLAVILGVSTDSLLNMDDSGTMYDLTDKELAKYLKEIEQMSEEEKAHVKYLLDAVIIKHYKGK